MKMLKRFIVLCLVVSTSATALAATETLELGPARVSMNLEGIGPYNVEKENPSQLNHNYVGYTFTYQFFPATIKANNTGNRVLIEVHQLSNPQSLDVPILQLNGKIGLEHCVEESDMMPSGNDIQRQPYYVDGYKGVAFIVNGNQKGPIYLAAYSPDLKDGFGKIVVIIGSDFPLNATKSIFESVKTQLLVQSDLASQSNTGLGIGNMGQSGLGLGNTVQSNVAQSNTGMGSIVQGQSNMGQGNMGQNSMSIGNSMGQGGMMGMMQSCMSMMQSMMGMNNMGSGGMASVNMGSGSVWDQGDNMGQSQSGMIGMGINQRNTGQSGMMM